MENIHNNNKKYHKIKLYADISVVLFSFPVNEKVVYVEKYFKAHYNSDYLFGDQLKLQIDRLFERFENYEISGF